MFEQPSLSTPAHLAALTGLLDSVFTHPEVNASLHWSKMGFQWPHRGSLCARVCQCVCNRRHKCILMMLPHPRNEQRAKRRTPGQREEAAPTPAR